MAVVSRCQFEVIHTRTMLQLLRVLKTKCIQILPNRNIHNIPNILVYKSQIRSDGGGGRPVVSAPIMSSEKYMTLISPRYCKFHTSPSLSISSRNGNGNDNENGENTDEKNLCDTIAEKNVNTTAEHNSRGSEGLDDLEISGISAGDNDLVNEAKTNQKGVTKVIRNKKMIKQNEAIKRTSRSETDDDEDEYDDGGDVSENSEKKLINILDPSDYLLQGSIENFLQDNEVFYEKGYTCHHTVCPKFGKLAMKKNLEANRLYINSLSGYFKCNNCGMRGNWSHLRDNIQAINKRINRTRECFRAVDDIDREIAESPPEVVRQMEGSQEFSTLSLDQFETILSIFDWHGLRRSTFTEYGVKYKIKENKYSILFPIQSIAGVVTAVRVYSGHVTEDGDIKTGHVYTHPKVKEVTDLFGWHWRPSKQTLVITSSEVNAMAISQETGITSLALRNITNLPQEILPDLEEFTKIILWLGTDIKAWENTKTFAKKLNDKRCYIFRPNTVHKMPIELLRTKEDIGTVMKKAHLISHKAILTFTNLRQEVYSELAHFKQVSGIQWKRYSKLNDLLKGHRRGELTILTGPTGSGKTTFVSEYSLDLCMQGVNTLWGSFEISNVRLAKVMMQQFAGKNLAKNLHDFDQIADDFSTLPLYFMAYFGQEHVNTVLEAMSHAVYVHDISHVIVDNLQFMMGMDYSERNRFIKQDHIVSLFRRFATEKNCHVTLIIHPRKVNEGEELSTASIFGSAKVTQEADNILLIQDQRLTKPQRRKYLQITKNRFDGDLGVMVLTFNKESLSFTVSDKKKNIHTKTDVQDKEKEHELEPI